MSKSKKKTTLSSFEHFHTFLFWLSRNQKLSRHTNYLPTKQSRYTHDTQARKPDTLPGDYCTMEVSTITHADTDEQISKKWNRQEKIQSLVTLDLHASLLINQYLPGLFADVARRGDFQHFFSHERRTCDFIVSRNQLQRDSLHLLHEANLLLINMKTWR